MTKKHLEKLAYRLANVEPENKDDKLVWKSCVHAVALACGDSNPRFDEERFLKACHFDYWKTHKIPA